MIARRIAIRVTLGALLAAVAALVITATWLLGTESGFAQLLALAGRVPGVRIEAKGAHGRLLSGFAIDELVIDQQRVRIVVRGLSGYMGLPGLPILGLRLRSLSAHDVVVTVRPAVRPPTHAAVVFMPRFLRIAVGQLAVALVEIRAPGGGIARFSDVGARITVTRSSIDATALRFNGGRYAIDGRADLGAADPLRLDADVNFTVELGRARLSGAATGTGTLESLAVTAESRAPGGAKFNGTLRVVGTSQLAGQLVLDHFDASAFGLATGALTGPLDVSGWINEFTLDGRVAAARLPFGPLNLTADAGYEQDSLRLTHLAASTTSGSPPTRLTARGRIDFGASPRLALQGEWAAFRWPPTGRAALLTSPNGTFRITGAGPFEYELSAAVIGPRLPATTLTASGSIDGTRLDVNSFDAGLAGGHASGSASFAFAAPRSWRVALHGRAIDPGAFRDRLKGRVNLDLQADGQGFEVFGRWDARLEHLDGIVRGLPARGAGAVSVRGKDVRLDDVHVSFGSAALDATGTVGARTDLRWTLKADRLADFAADARGTIRSQGAASGDLAHLSVHASLGASGVAFGEWQAAAVNVAADLDASDQESSSLSLVALDVGRGTRRADQFRITLEGKASDHALDLKGSSGSDAAELGGRGAYRDGVWTLRIESLATSGSPLFTYRLATPATLVVSPDAVSLTRMCVEHEQSKLCTEGGWSDVAPWEASVDATAIPAAIVGIAMPRNTEFGGPLSARASVHGAPGRESTGEAALDFAGMELRYRGPNGHDEKIGIATGKIAIQAQPDFFDGKGDVATVAGSKITASVRIGRGDAPYAQAPLSGTLSVATTELGAVPLFVPGVDRVAGRLEADCRLSGTLGAPLLAGKARLTAGEIDVPRTNLLLRDVNADLAFDGDHVELTARATTRGGSATASGELHWRDRAPIGELEFSGDKLLVADLPEAKIVASPRLNFKVDHTRITVRGDVTIPSAHIAPRDLRGAVLASSDERIVSDKGASPESAFAVDATVRLVLGDDITIDAYGLKGKLGGTLTVTARPGEIPFGTGELNVREGKYTAYTRQLDIERGRLLFAGQNLGNPGLDIRAQRKFDTTIAGVNVRGTLLSPQMTFYSDPAMTQSQIAALLILGKTMEDIQDPTKTPLGGSDTRTALAEGGALLGGQLGRYVGISEVGVETDSNNAASLVIGKYLSPRLYISYGVSLTEAINTLKLRYTIGDRWVIKTESGLQQSADIEYSIGH